MEWSEEKGSIMCRLWISVDVFFQKDLCFLEEFLFSISILSVSERYRFRAGNPPEFMLGGLLTKAEISNLLE